MFQILRRLEVSWRLDRPQKVERISLIQYSARDSNIRLLKICVISVRNVDIRVAVDRF